MSVTVSHPTDRPNFSVVDIGYLTIWFSYRTPIAFSSPGTGTVARVNDWSATTGKHLNHVGVPREKRIPGSDFQVQLQAAIVQAADRLTEVLADAS